MINKGSYPNIDMEKTGMLLKEKIAGQGYTVRDIQDYLQLSCPQPVYRWFKGKVLPSLDHLLMLSRILKVHMEELLVLEEDIQMQKAEQNCYVAGQNDVWEANRHFEERCVISEDMPKRLDAYWKLLGIGAA